MANNIIQNNSCNTGLRECKITFIYPHGSKNVYLVSQVNYKAPYRYSKWLFTQLIDDWPYLSYEAKDDEELLTLFGKQALNSIQINIEYLDNLDNETENTINT